MEIAARNRAIKKVVEEAFGRGKVTVRGHRGTSYGWVTINIDYAPRNNEEWRELDSKVRALIRAAGIPTSKFYSDEGATYACMHVNFDRGGF